MTHMHTDPNIRGACHFKLQEGWHAASDLGAQRRRGQRWRDTGLRYPSVGVQSAGGALAAARLYLLHFIDRRDNLRISCGRTADSNQLCPGTDLWLLRRATRRSPLCGQVCVGAGRPRSLDCSTRSSRASWATGAGGAADGEAASSPASYPAAAGVPLRWPRRVSTCKRARLQLGVSRTWHSGIYSSECRSSTGPLVSPSSARPKEGPTALQQWVVSTTVCCAGAGLRNDRSPQTSRGAVAPRR